MAEPPPWADGLPDDALREIVRRVPCAIDRGSMAGVCREWRTRLARLPRPPPQFPWLIVSSDDSTRAYCVLSGGCVHHYRTNAPPHGARFFGSCEGAWLFLAFDQTSDNELVNLRHDRTLLAPDTFRLGEDDPFADGHGMAILAAALSSPPDKKNCVGACIISRWPAAPAPRRFAFWNVAFEGVAYDVMPDPDPSPPQLEVEDVLCRNGVFYFLTQGEHIRVCKPVPDEAAGPLQVVSDVRYFQPEGRNYQDPVRARYLLESRDELLMVVRFAPDPDSPTSGFMVFRVNGPREQEGDQVEVEYPWSWDELESLGGRMLFVGRGCSRSYEVVQYPGFKDGIYFLDDRCFYDKEMMFHRADERRYPCNDNGMWSQGPAPNVELFFPEQGPSDRSPPAWLVLSQWHAKHLPLDLVLRIIRQVICDTDRVRALRAWCLKLSDSELGARAIQPQLPWFLKPSSRGTAIWCLTCGNHSMSAKHSTGAPLDVRHARFYGSFDCRWLFFVLKTGQHMMGNLLTGERHHLPDQITFHQGGSYPQSILAATISAPPDLNSNSSCIGAAIVRYQHPTPNPIMTSQFGEKGSKGSIQIGLWSFGDLVATDPLSGLNTPVYVEADDIGFYKGSLYCISRGDHLLVWTPTFPDGKVVLDDSNDWKHFFVQYELNGGQLEHENHFCSRYLVISRGQLLLILRYYSCANRSLTEKFSLFTMEVPKFDISRHGAVSCICTLQPSLDGRMLFVGRGCSRSYETADYPGLKDGVYFSDDRSFYDEQIMFRSVDERQYPCSDNGKWTEGSPPCVVPFLPEQELESSSNSSSAVWLLP